MRLKQIKLSGFKSFVDATSFEVPSQLVGVVGPNGCGKSNIMDALRWVLGESKASELRGESMQDVIFNGSSDRKPAVRASVELIFDNAQSRLGGAWAGFAEISVKRTLTRDGQSSYLINQQVVRRKDVHDMFLGTGLGPRAYAMIGQGTVSRIVEAKPDELRVFLEEAAGVSKYKERRRETEHRLTDTRENLQRVEDIVRELDAQLSKLERQAEVARQFRDLERERDAAQRMFWLVRRDEAQAEQVKLAQKNAGLQTEMEAELAAQRHVEAQLERARQMHADCSDAAHRLQGAYYDAHGAVARLEGEIRRVAEARGQLTERVDALTGQMLSAQQRERDGVATQERLDMAWAVAQERQSQAECAYEEQVTALPTLDEQARLARQSLDAARKAEAQTSLHMHGVAVRWRAVQEAQAAVRVRLERLEQAWQQLGPAPVADLERLSVALAEASEAEAVAHERLQQDEDAWARLDAQRAPAQEALRLASAQLTQVSARLTALQHLQDQTRNQGKAGPWLTQHGFAQRARLWEKLRIEPGWEAAVEAVLRERVQALELDELESLAGVLEKPVPAKLAFYALAPEYAPVVSSGALAGRIALAEYVQITEPALRALLHDALAHVWVCDSVQQALAGRAQLPPGHSLIVRAGHRMGRWSVRLHALDTEQDGVLARQHELDGLVREQRALILLAEEARQRAMELEASVAQSKAQVWASRETQACTVRAVAALRLQVERCTLQVQQVHAERARMEQEKAEVQADWVARQVAETEEHASLAVLEEQIAIQQDECAAALVVWEGADQALGVAREALRDTERRAREAEFAVRELHAQRQRVVDELALARQQYEQGAAEKDGLLKRLDELSDEAAQAALQDAVAQRLAAEQSLTTARVQLDACALEVRELDQARVRHERAQEPLRVQLNDVQLKEQAARLTMEQFAAYLHEAQVDESSVRACFSAAPRASALQTEVNRLNAAIQALGAVNLAALEELSAGRERRDFLAAQSADLLDAITTLEDAIRKIDRETRTLLQDTFATVNRHFGSLFPELFGGGEARLVLTGEEILDAGISIVAQPPGKRNQSVHLLSGGEKALTAIALVFAMFALNPAPFCLLDEVDAPLDDANTERYCAMVRRMSAHTQFLFITHNKIAMELAQQLVGVTMQERGVSRIVAVDLEAAARFVEAA